MKASFKWFFDLSTSDTEMQQIKVTAGGKQAVYRLGNLFAAYSRYKVGSVRVTFRPCATLPVDPTGLSYDVGENTVNPTDLFNPGLIKITHGSDFVDLDALSNLGPINPSQSTAVQEAMYKQWMHVYYTMLMDKRYRKFPLQRGFSIATNPLYWTVGNIRQETFPNAVRNMPGYGSIASGENPTFEKAKLTHGSSAYTGKAQNQFAASTSVSENSSEAGLFQTGHKVKCGWQPTTFNLADELGLNINKADGAGINTPVEIPLMQILTPITRKTKFYFRVYVTETYYFSRPVVQNVHTSSDWGIDPIVHPDLAGNWAGGLPDHFIGTEFKALNGPTDTIQPFETVSDTVPKQAGLGDNDGHLDAYKE